MVLFPKKGNTSNQLSTWLSQSKASGKENIDHPLSSWKEMTKNAGPFDDDDFQPITRKRVIPLAERLRRQSSELSSLHSVVKREQTPDEEELVDFSDTINDPVQSVVKKEVEEEEEEEVIHFDNEPLIKEELAPKIKKERIAEEEEEEEEEIMNSSDFASQMEPEVKKEKAIMEETVIVDSLDEDSLDDVESSDDEEIEDLTNWTPSSQPPQIFTPSPSPPPYTPSSSKGKRRATQTSAPEALNIPKRQRPTTAADRQCPLCLKRFAPDVIEAHASECVGTESSQQRTRQSLIDEQFPTVRREPSIERPEPRRRETPIERLAQRRRQQQPPRRRTPSPIPDEHISDIEEFEDENNQTDNSDYRKCPVCNNYILAHELQNHVNAEIDRQESSAEPQSSLSDLRDSFDVVNVSDDNQEEEDDDGYLSPLEGFVNINERPEQFQQYFNQGQSQGQSSSGRGSSSRNSSSRGTSRGSSRGRASSSRPRQETDKQAARRRAKFARRNARYSNKKQKQGKGYKI